MKIGIPKEIKTMERRVSIYIEEGMVHYCVTNMPGAVPRTSTYALTNVTLPYVLEMANKGYKKAFKENAALAKGLNVCHGKLTNSKVAEAFNRKFTEYKGLGRK